MADRDLIQIIEVVNSIKDCDIQKQTRVRTIVDGKRIYTALAKRLCPEKTHEQIAEAINVSHCSITHYLKDFEELKQQTPELREAYKFCLEICLNMLGKESNNYMENILRAWQNLTTKQQKIVSDLAIYMLGQNKETENPQIISVE
jgi:tRNA/tmRNA/rRNA uracil-C5-methylase (TrmA/RlmC/RlmD family)